MERKPPGYWTKERCKEAALEYKSRTEFGKKSSGAYAATIKNGWMGEIGLHLKRSKSYNFKWTKEKCYEVALKCDKMTTFILTYGSAYNSAKKNGWVDEISSHMIETRKIAGYWNDFERCQEEALKYNSKVSFNKKSRGSYKSALKNGWLDEICSHMILKQKPKGYWTYERCKEEALKYKTKYEYEQNNKGSYLAAMRSKWLDNICSHMVSTQKPTGYWTKEKCHKEALKCNTYQCDFHRNSPAAFSSASKKGWIKEICSHLTKPYIPQGSFIIYVYEFKDNYFYVGLTRYEKTRKLQHKSTKSSQVFKHINKTGLIPKYKTLECEIEHPELAKSQEEYWLQKYISNGWVKLNVAKTGSIGGYRIKN